MAKYHINPESGEAGLCRAKHNCPFGDLETEHYSTAEDARKAYEAKMARESLPDLIKTAAEVSPAEASGALLRTEPYIQKLKKLTGGLIIDMDDTLNTNQTLFVDSREEVAKICNTLSGGNATPKEVEDAFQESFARWLPVYGYTPKRWMVNCHEVAEQFAGRPLTDSEHDEVQRAAEIAMGVGDIMPGVADALTALHEAGIPMVLKTKGELNKQQEKLAAHGFGKWFRDRVEIVDVKDPASFRAVADKYGLTDPISVGDSEKSDVLPAVEAGFDAVLIVHDHLKWDWDPSHQQVDGVARAGSFPQAIQFLADEAG